jgi:hypothetical protein
MSRLFIVVSVSVSVALGVAAPSPAAAAPTCAMGHLPRSLASGVRAAYATAERRFARRTPAPTDAAQRAFATGLAAYVYGYPRVSLALTVQRYPVNSIIAITHLAEATTKAVVAPNHDTLYSVGHLDLSGGPLVVQTPNTHGRYSVLQLLDGFTNSFAYLGVGSAGQRGERVLLVPPGWTGQVPAGLRLVRSPSKLVWLLGRTLVDGEADTAAAAAVMRGNSVTPLASWQAGTTVPPKILADFPGSRAVLSLPTGIAFFEALSAQLAGDPPPPVDRCAVTAFSAAGIGPGAHPASGADPAILQALAAAADAGPKLIDAFVDVLRKQGNHGGWNSAGPDVGSYGSDYAGRAAVAHVGLGANTPQRALYPVADRDARGRRLDGRHTYTLRFARGQLPPVRAFWSLTLYGADGLFYANPANRYSVGDRTGLQRNRDGSLTIRVGHRRPAGPRSNWLPAPNGRFSLYLRLYEPKPAAAKGRWKPPAIVRTG